AATRAKRGALSCVYPGSSPAAIDDIVAEFSHLPTVSAAPNSWFEEQFSAEKQARMLDAIIRMVHQRQCGTTTRNVIFPKHSRSSIVDEKEKSVGNRSAPSVWITSYVNLIRCLS